MKWRMEGKQVEGMTETDRQVCQVRHAMDTLSAQIGHLESTLDHDRVFLQHTLKEKKKNKQELVSTLQRMKRVQHVLQHRHHAYEQLHQVWTRLEQSETDAMVLDAMEAGTGVLKRVVSAMGGVERAERVVDALEACVMDQHEIQDALSRVNVGIDVDENALEMELQHLELETYKKEEKEEKEKEEKKGVNSVSGVVPLSLFPETPRVSESVTKRETQTHPQTSTIQPMTAE